MDNGKERLRVLHVTPAYYPATYWGGPITSLYELCNALAVRDDVQIRVLTTDSAGPKLSQRIAWNRRPSWYEPGYEVFFHRRIAGADFAPGMFAQLVALVRWADVVHLTGVYSPPTIPTLTLAALLRKPVVWSPRGALQRWNGSTRTVAKGLWDSVCNAFVNRLTACVLHVTSQRERDAAAKRIPRADVTVIPNGVSVEPRDAARAWRPEGMLRLLYLGRLHRIKGLENLFRALVSLPKEVELTVCGTGDRRYVTELRALVAALGLEGRVNFKGEVTGPGKAQAFREADICVLPSYSENFGMVVAESLAHGVPVITSRATPWAGVEEHRCGCWVENDPESLADAILRISKEDLPAMGERGRRWMEKEFSWSSTAERMVALYRKLTQTSRAEGRI